MTKVVGEIAIEVGADIGPLVREMSRGGDVLDRFRKGTDRLGKGLDRFAERTTALGKKLSIVSGVMAAVGVAAFALARDVATMGDEIGDSAKAAGMSTTAFQEYRFALKEAAAMTDEDFNGAVAKLNKTLGEAKGGSESAIKAFEAIGVSQAQLSDAAFTTDQAMAAFIASAEATKDPALAAAQATDLFGKSGATLGASLSGVPGQVEALVGRARELGVVMGPDAVEAAGKFDQKMNELGAQFEVVKMKIAEVLLPIIVDKLIPVLQDVVLPAIVSVAQKIGEWITAFGDLDPAIQSVVGWVTAAFAVGGPVLLAIGAVASAISGLIAATGPIGLLIAAAVALTTAWQVWGEDFKAAVGGAIDYVTGLWDAFVQKLQGAIQIARDVGTAISDALTFQQGDGQINNGLSVPSSGPVPDAGWIQGSSSSTATGAAMADGLVEGLQLRLAERLPDVAAAVQTVTDQARTTLGVHSPSTVFAEIGHFMAEGMAQGISSSTALVGQAVKGMTDTAVGAADEGVAGVLTAMGGLFEGSKKISAGIAIANSWLAFTEVLKDPSFIGRPWARVAAAFAALKPGLQAAKNIMSARPGGGGGGGGASSAGAAAGPAAGSGGIMNITLTGNTHTTDSVASLFEQMNVGLRQGYTLNLVRA